MCRLLRSCCWWIFPLISSAFFLLGADCHPAVTGSTPQPPGPTQRPPGATQGPPRAMAATTRRVRRAASEETYWAYSAWRLLLGF
ncbi:unnamed protein product [Gadus morhua 'NCC']